MITVRLFGLLRLDTGVKELPVEAGSVKELYRLLPREIARTRPGAKVTAKDLEGCVVLINGKPGNKGSKLRSGDEVMLLSPVCGG